MAANIDFSKKEQQYITDDINLKNQAARKQKELPIDNKALKHNYGLRISHRKYDSQQTKINCPEEDNQAKKYIRKYKSGYLDEKRIMSNRYACRSKSAGNIFKDL